MHQQLRAKTQRPNMSAMTVCVAILCLLLLAHRSNAFASKRPFVTRTRLFPRLWEFKEDHDPHPSPLSEYTMQRESKSPSDNAALQGEAMTEESGKDQPFPFVMQNGIKDPSENATSQESTLEETANEGLEPASLTTNECKDADSLAEESSNHVHEMTSVIQMKDVQVALEDNSTDTIAGEVEVTKSLLLGDDPVDVEDKQDADYTSPVVEVIPENILDTPLKTNDGSDDVIAPSMGTLEDSPDFLFDSPGDELESDPFIDTKGTLEEVQTEPMVDMMTEDILDIPLETKDGSDDVIAPAIGTLEDSPDFLFDSTGGDLESDPFIETKSTLEEDLQIDSRYMAEVQTEPMVDMMPEDILDIPLETNDGSDDVVAPAIGTLGDSPDFPFESTGDDLESDPVIDTKGALEEDTLLDSRHMAEANTEHTVDMMPKDMLDIQLNSKDETTVLIEKVDTSESTMTVKVHGNEANRLIPAIESAVLKEDTGEKANFFFGTTFDEAAAVLRRIKNRKNERKESNASRSNEELSLLEELQTAKDKLEEVKRQSALDVQELRVEARRREAEWRERLNDMIAKVEIAEELNAQTQSKMQHIVAKGFDYEVEAKEWKDRYARDSPLWTERYERELQYRRQEQIAARERLAKTQSDYREIIRLAKEEGRQKAAGVKLEMLNQLEQKEMRLRANDIKLKQLQNTLEASNKRIAELEGECTSLRELVRQAWVIVKGRLQKKSAMIKGRLQKIWSKRQTQAEETIK